ncbi:hypothetical protein QVE09_24235 [Paenibacillus sp. ClWae2A]|uniref:hypothetical protein n=1 Tax=Paenibacillus sp. ClWae2A TaxID=3057177 RepID=UPI0028F4EE49|nr:hypothetical protein [Paenibacillus sp. ClWae2A]MDT9722021.1 hypothetical protein [Paenibacillus sp. ClWae2A]
MRISCSPGFPGSMIGSIDLQPSKYYTPPSSNSQITDHVDPELVTIPYVEDPGFGSHFDAMKVMKGTYKDEMHVSYDVEFTIDVDKKGYITQFEHTFQLERYLDLVRTQSYKVIKTNWRGQTFHVMTYSYLEEVIHPKNVLFKCNLAEDVFVIAELVSNHADGSATEHGIRDLHFRALISARDDLYPIDYMCEPDFDLSLD